jgi:hypothetical protein
MDSGQPLSGILQYVIELSPPLPASVAYLTNIPHTAIITEDLAHLLKTDAGELLMRLLWNILY